MFGIFIGGTLVLDGCKSVLSAAGQQFGVQEVYVGSLFAVWKRTQVELIPAPGFCIDPGFVLLLGKGMVVACYIPQMTLYLGQNIWGLHRVMLLPVVTGRLVAHYESLLLFQYSFSEPCLLVDIDDARLEHWRFAVLWMHFGKQAIGICGVCVAFLA